MFDVVWSGKRHVMMGATQVDQYGNQNIAAIGDYAQPRTQLLGFRGAPGNTINDTTSLLGARTTAPRCSCEAVDIVCGIGYDRAAALGPVAARFHEIRRVVTNLCVLDFETPDHRMRLRSVHPGVTVDEVVAATGFELVVPDDVRRVPPADRRGARPHPRGHRPRRPPASARSRTPSRRSRGTVRTMLGRRRRDPLAGSGLRDRIFDIDPSEVGLRPDGSRHVWGVVFDQATDSGVVSLVSLIDGTTSLAMGSGGGVVGGGAYELVAPGLRGAGLRRRERPRGPLASDDREHPRLGSTRFWALTYSGTLMAQADTDSLGRPDAPALASQHGCQRRASRPVRRRGPLTVRPGRSSRDGAYPPTCMAPTCSSRVRAGTPGTGTSSSRCSRQPGTAPSRSSLPASDPDAGLDAYVAAALDAVGPPEGDAVVVGQSLGGFTAPVVAERLGAAMLVFVAAMIPKPGETAGDWWATSGFHDVWGDQEMDAMEHFLHDLPPNVLQEALERGEPEQTGRVMTDPFPLAGPAGDPDARDRGDERPLLPGRLHGPPHP